MYLYQIIKHVRICLYIYFKHDISRKSAVQLLLFLVVKRSKNYNAVVSRQIIQIRLLLFLLFETNYFDVFTIYSELSGLKGNVLFMDIYIPMKSSILSLTKYAIFMSKRRRKKIIL